jgi:hypothetical protein
VVLKPVLTAMARATASSSLSSCGRLARMILVPQNRKCLASSGAMDEAAKLSSRRDSSLVGTFDTGTDSPTTIRIYPYYVTTMLRQGLLPVSMLSFTMQSPARRMLSQGNWVRAGSVTS